MPALSAEGDVDVSVRIHRGIAHRMQVVRDLHAQRHRKRRAFHAAHAHAHCAARRAFGNLGDQQIVRGHHQAGFGWAELHLRARVIAHRKPVAPDGKLASRQGCRWFYAFNSWRSVHLCEQSSFFPGRDQTEPSAPALPTSNHISGLRAGTTIPGLHSRGARYPQTDRGINPRDPIVRHDSQSARQTFRLPRGSWLPNIEYSKKYKTQHQIFPVNGRERQQISKKLPETSSMTTQLGSFFCRYFAARSAAQTPTIASSSATAAASVAFFPITFAKRDLARRKRERPTRDRAAGR